MGPSTKEIKYFNSEGFNDCISSFSYHRPLMVRVQHLILNLMS